MRFRKQHFESYRSKMYYGISKSSPLLIILLRGGEFLIELYNVLPVVLVACVVFINGWTDVPNAITGIVVTGVLSHRAALCLAATCAFLGLITGSFVNASVADTMLSLMNFGGVSRGEAAAALCAAMLTILIFALAAWFFGIPTSESHALAAALAGAFAACGGGLSQAGWPKIIAGLALSLLLGGGLGRLFIILFGGILRRLPPGIIVSMQLFSAGAMAFMHGAQDGLKFIAVLVAAEAVGLGNTLPGAVLPSQHLPALFLCAFAMMLGTATGGQRIIYHTGESMVKLDRASSVCADFGSAICLLTGSLSGIPMSTTHTKTAAMMGAGKNANLRVVGGILLAWGVTFPVCAATAYLLMHIFKQIQCLTIA